MDSALLDLTNFRLRIYGETIVSVMNMYGLFFLVIILEIMHCNNYLHSISLGIVTDLEII